MFRGNGTPLTEASGADAQRQHTISLDQLAVGRSAQVVTLEGGHVFRERVSSMGLRPGARVEVLRRGRATPLLVAVGHARLALGHGMSARVLVREDVDTPAPESSGKH